MSRTTKAINSIVADFSRISGLTGIVSDLVEIKATEIHAFVEYVLEHHPEANAFDFFGQPKNEEET